MLPLYLPSCLSLSYDSHDLWFLLSSSSLLCWKWAFNNLVHLSHCFPPPPFFVFVFCQIFSSSLLISYIQLHLRYGHPNFLFFPPATFYMPHIYFMSFSLYVGLFLTSYYKTVFTVPILFLLSCGTKVWPWSLVHLLARRVIKCDCPTVGLSCLIKPDTSACYAIPFSLVLCHIRSCIKCSDF